jgi:hypothetical protein
MNTVLAQPLTGQDLTGMLMFVLIFLGLISGLLIIFWFGYREKCLNAALKREMIARGYTAGEIVAVLAAKTDGSPTNLPDVPPAKPIKQAGYGV